HVDTVNDPNDLNQFANQIDQANESLPDPCEVACADAGYADTDELEKVDALGIKVIVPSQRQALRNGEGPFSKSNFTYKKEKDCYYCPQGHILLLKSIEKKKGRKGYIIADREHCHRCKNYGKCTTSEIGRKVTRGHNEELKEKLEVQYEEDASQKIYDRRKNRVELPFGHIKRNLKTDAFLLRGRNGAQAETSLLATCFNMARMITIYGVSSLIKEFRDREVILAT
ncbi:MAG: transposase, partial [PVC group bacterium]|nr:transposase [PVC group bacterium]